MTTREGQATMTTPEGTLPTGRSASIGATLDAILTILIAVVLGFIVSCFYGFLWNGKAAVLALLASVLGYAFGGLFGFLFGFPRYLDVSAITGVDDLRKPTNDAKNNAQPSLKPNLSLERIVDWLLTMIIGATLVNIKELVGWIAVRFAGVGRVITGTDSAMIGALLIVPFTIAGFLHLYMWSRRYLIAEWGESDREAQKRQERVLGELTEKVVKLDETQQQVVNVVDQVRSEVFKVEGDKALALKTHLDGLGVPTNITSDIVQRLTGATQWEDDPFKDFAKPLSDRFRMTAQISAPEVAANAGQYEVTVTVEATDGTNSGDVVFLLHNTYDTPYAIKVIEADGKASIKFDAFGAFVVGAVVVEKATATGSPPVTLLAFDLATIPSVPADFLA